MIPLELPTCSYRIRNKVVLPEDHRGFYYLNPYWMRNGQGVRWYCGIDWSMYSPHPVVPVIARQHYISEVMDLYRPYKQKRVYYDKNGKPVQRWSYLPFKLERSGFAVEPGSLKGAGFNGCAPDGDPLHLCCLGYIYPNNTTAKPLFPNAPGWVYRDHEPFQVSSPLDPKQFNLEENRSAIENAVSDLVASLLAEAAGKRSTLPDLGVQLVELTELGSLFKRPERVSGAYLQGVFGAKPTIQSVKDYINGAITSIEKMREFHVTTGHRRVRLKDITLRTQLHNRTSCVWYNGDSRWLEPCPKGGKDEEKQQLSIVVGLESVYRWRYQPMESVLGRLYGLAAALNALGDAGSVWETIPFSWLIDWFLPIGRILSALSALFRTGKWADLMFIDSYVSTRMEWVHSLECASLPCFVSPSTFSYYARVYRRVPVDPDTLLRSFPGLRLPKRLSQALISAALADQWLR